MSHVRVVLSKVSIRLIITSKIETWRLFLTRFRRRQYQNKYKIQNGISGTRRFISVKKRTVEIGCLMGCIRLVHRRPANSVLI